MSLPDRRLVLFLLLGGVFGQQFGLDVGRNLDVLCELHLEGAEPLSISWFTGILRPAGPKQENKQKL